MPADRSSGRKKSSSTVDRVWTDVVLPIKPEFVELIAKGDKNHEYRKYKLRETVVRLWLYETAPASRIRYVVQTAKPKVPGEVKDPSGIGNDDFDNGLKVSKYGYPVLKVHKLESQIDSREMKSRFGLGVPQSYCFMPKTMFDSLDVTHLPVHHPPSKALPRSTDSTTDSDGVKAA